MTKYLLKAMAFLLSCLMCSCTVFDGTVQVRDRGFDIAADIVWNNDYMSYTLRLFVERGEVGKYKMEYVFDDDPLVNLRTTGSGNVPSGDEVILSDKGGTVFILPTLSPSARHTLSLTLTREGVSRHYSLDLPNTNQRQIGMRLDTSADLSFTRLIVTNLRGASVTSYSLSFYIDSELCEEMKYSGSTFGGMIEVDFSKYESFTFELPYLLPGEHILRLDVKSPLGSESNSVTFSEPERRRTELKFRYNDFTGNLMLSSPYNPISTAFDITLDITVKGKITYRHDQFFGVADETTESFTMTTETSSSLTPSLGEASIDNGALKNLLDRMHSQTRTDAANAIGNGNRRNLYTDITSVDLRFTIHSKGAYAGQTSVMISPTLSNDFPIRYTYEHDTWSHSAANVQTIAPSFSINGQPASSLHQL